MSCILTKKLAESRGTEAQVVREAREGCANNGVHLGN